MLRHTLLIVCVACTSALADVHRTAPGSFRWHPSLGDSMVLQRSPGRAAVFGFGAPPNANCEAQLNGGWQGDKTAAADGSWRLELGVQGASTQGSVLTVSCAGAPYNLTARDVVFGDVYITSGQSNMELPVEHTFSYWNVSLNETRYFEQPNIRVTKVPHNLQLQPATTLGAPLIWSRANWSALKGHSAISYYFAKELSTMLEGGDAAPVGIIESSWGGTIIESWLSLEAQQGCGYRICGPDAPKHKVCNASVMDSHQQPGSLFNGMIMPLAQLTIKAALWYQGENNGANSNGTYVSHTGYHCLLPALVNNWRATFAANGATAADFPVGVVSLHAWCGEEEANCVSGGARTNHVSQIRWAETADAGRLPNPRLPNTFTAMAYDLPDPRIGYPYYVSGKLAPGQLYYNCSSAKATFPNAEYASQAECEAHPPPLPKPLMGSIHPRNKRLLGQRLARAAKAVVYGDKSVAYTGPVLAGCSVAGKQLTLQFDSQLFRGGESLHFKGNNLGNLTSNLEVEVDGAWHMLPISSASPSTSVVVAVLPSSMEAPSAIRYAWYDNPACPHAYDHFHRPGNPGYYCLDSTYDVTQPGQGYDATSMCALYSTPSDLPAVPFMYPLATTSHGTKCVMAD